MSDRTLGTSLLSPRSVYLTLKGRQEQRRKRNECVDEWVGGESDTPVFSHLIAYLSTVLSLTLNFLPSCLFCACFTYPTFLYYTNKAACDNRSAIVRSIAWHDGGGETKAAPPPPPPSCQQCDQPGNQPTHTRRFYSAVDTAFALIILSLLSYASSLSPSPSSSSFIYPSIQSPINFSVYEWICSRYRAPHLTSSQSIATGIRVSTDEPIWVLLKSPPNAVVAPSDADEASTHHSYIQF
uniref:Uncharacterized protein n=1 Tax=Echinococcus granulosus TaxID=6210 RepID=A0A068WXT8_ECHGR|nr:hypothetical protein EgrG_002050600 [Echinococcus granulosus]